MEQIKLNGEVAIQFKKILPWLVLLSIIISNIPLFFTLFKIPLFFKYIIYIWVFWYWILVITLKNTSLKINYKNIIIMFPLLVIICLLLLPTIKYLKSKYPNDDNILKFERMKKIKSIIK